MKREIDRFRPVGGCNSLSLRDYSNNTLPTQEAKEMCKEDSKGSKFVMYSKLRMNAVVSRNMRWQVKNNEARKQYSAYNYQN